VKAAAVGAIEGHINVTGMVMPAPGAEWTIVAPEAARIAELPKAEGDRRRVGDVLVRSTSHAQRGRLATRAEVSRRARASTARAPR
jgi:multidrug efflux pump subunit AcrA (membrane-fusion protein)